MIKIENVEVHGWESAIRGCRNPLNSWERMDSYGASNRYVVGPNDHDLMMRLAKAGSEHAKYRRMIVVWLDVTAPLYWWAEADTYKVGTVRNSCSKMHRIHSKEFTMDDFSHEHMTSGALDVLNTIIEHLNFCRKWFLAEGQKSWWWQMIQLLPSSYNQRRTVLLNYEVLTAIYRDRRKHKLDEWHTVCDWIESLPHSDIITG
jgi:hypothetical protein